MELRASPLHVAQHGQRAQQEAAGYVPAAHRTELAVVAQQRRSELQAIAEKIGEIESDADEHRYARTPSYAGSSSKRSRASRKRSRTARVSG